MELKIATISFRTTSQQKDRVYIEESSRRDVTPPQQILSLFSCRRTSVSIDAGFFRTGAASNIWKSQKERLKLSARNKSTACHPISCGAAFYSPSPPIQTHTHTRAPLSKFGRCCSLCHKHATCKIKFQFFSPSWLGKKTRAE